MDDIFRYLFFVLCFCIDIGMVYLVRYVDKVVDIVEVDINIL